MQIAVQVAPAPPLSGQFGPPTNPNKVLPALPIALVVAAMTEKFAKREASIVYVSTPVTVFPRPVSAGISQEALIELTACVCDRHWLAAVSVEQTTRFRGSLAALGGRTLTRGEFPLTEPVTRVL